MDKRTFNFKGVNEMGDMIQFDLGQLGKLTDWQRTNQCALCDREEVTEIRVRPTGPNMELQRWGFCATCANEYDERIGVYMDDIEETREESRNTYRKDHNDYEAKYSAAEMYHMETEAWTGGGELWCSGCARDANYHEVVPAEPEDFDGTPMCAQCGKDLS